MLLGSILSHFWQGRVRVSECRRGAPGTGQRRMQGRFAEAAEAGCARYRRGACEGKGMHGSGSGPAMAFPDPPDSSPLLAELPRPLTDISV